MKKFNTKGKIEYDFWNNWKNVTKQEKIYIGSLKKSRTIILKSFPKKKICAIYVKGSFVRRELTPQSDIDIVIIVKDSRTLNQVTNFSKNHKESLKPAEIVTPYSLWEFKHSKSYPHKLSKSPPAVFLYHLEHHKLIWGNPIANGKYKVKSPQHRLKGLVNFLEHKYIPAYNRGESFGFRFLAKQVFWLTDLELTIKENYSSHSFKDMAKHIKDKNHIIHNAIRIRNMKTTKDPRLREKFLKKLKIYLNKLKRLH